jgi:3-deoxy-manno-octulosonate cytidylyltransferase (CMP-KDO synthetase)
MRVRWKRATRCSGAERLARPLFHVVIPARYAAARFPGKPLALLGGRPLIQWVWERTRGCGAASVIIATDDERIGEVVRAFGAVCAMTSPTHTSGTDRVAEVAAQRNFADDDVIVNVQGDEPLIEPQLVADLAASLRERPSFDIATAVAPIGSLEEFLDPNCVKAVRAADGRALYFSRAPVPWPRDAGATGRPESCRGAWRHIGVYAYRGRSLRQFTQAAPTPLEQSEKLEQLRALEHGMSIYCHALAVAPPAGVDTPADLERLRARLGGG